MAHVPQTPNEAKKYTLQWLNWLISGETISANEWSIRPSIGVTVTNLGSSDTNTSVKISGLTRGEVYVLTGQITSSGGETGEQSISIRCEK